MSSTTDSVLTAREGRPALACSPDDGRSAILGGSHGELRSRSGGHGPGTIQGDGRAVAASGSAHARVRGARPAPRRGRHRLRPGPSLRGDVGTPGSLALALPRGAGGAGRGGDGPRGAG